MAQATGIIEVFGLAAAFVALDAGCKAANVTAEHFDKNKPGNADALPVPLIVCVKFRGSVSDVTAAVEAGALHAKDQGVFCSSSVIAAPHEALWEQM
jgi:microcompartment protein CcmL/EutN